MSGIKPVITDLLAKLATIQVQNQDGQTVPIYSHIWNNQLAYAEDGKGYSWPRPSAFIEIVSPAQFEIIGLGFRSADLGIRIHLVHDFFDAQDGTYEQDLTIFDLRDKVVSAHNTDTTKQSGLSQYCLTACGPLNCVSESQDYDHGNLYHYILEFICNFTDSKGSKYDPANGQFIETSDPDLDLLVDLIPKPDDYVPENDYFIIPQKQ